VKKSILFLLALVLSACSSVNLMEIDILLPSNYQVRPEVQDIVIINNAREQASNVGHRTYRQSTNNYHRKRKMSDDIIEVDSTGATAIYNMYNHLVESHLFSSVEIGRKEAKPHIAYTHLDKAAIQYPGDALLFLESLRYTDDKNITYDNYSGTNFTEIRVLTRSQWLLYYPDESTKPYRFTIKDTLYWNQEDADRADCVLQGVWNNAKLASEHISPYWKTVERLYYTGASYVYKEIEASIKKQDWEKAGELWMAIYNGEKKNTLKKARMAFNMALFFEMKNDLETAMSWLGEACETFEKKGNQNDLRIYSIYVTILNNRLLLQERIDAQYMH